MHAVVVTALVIAAIALSSPDFLEIDLPVVAHNGGGAFWWESHRTELAYDDSAGVLYVHRQVGTAYATPSNGRPRPTCLPTSTPGCLNAAGR